jgi:hypothetical protein
MTGSSAVRLGQGSANGFSPDGKWVLVLRQNITPVDFVLLPTGVGEQRGLPTGNVVPQSGQFFPDSKRIVFQGNEPGHGTRVYVTSLDGGQPKAITPEGFALGTYPRAVSPDGKQIALVSSDGIALVSAEGGDPQPVRGSQPNDAPLQWMKGNALLVGQRGETSCPVWKLDLQTGARTPWKTVAPADVAGVTGVSCPRLAADEQHYAFGYVRDLSDLFLVEHLK